ncbi:MAG: ABC transporter permease, partial [Clostridiales bacterium]|nr:ABC transporter permease [Clostridiales bacterium]
MDNNSDNLDHLFILHPYERDVTEITEYSNYSYWRSTIHTFFQSKLGVSGLIIGATVVLFSIVQQYFPNEAGKIALENARQPYEWIFYLTQYDMWKSPPDALHWFGTDSIGRDMWARVWYATRISMLLAFLVALFEVIIGFIVGAVWGYVRSMDKFMIEVYNAIRNIP